MLLTLVNPFCHNVSIIIPPPPHYTTSLPFQHAVLRDHVLQLALIICPPPPPPIQHFTLSAHVLLLALIISRPQPVCESLQFKLRGRGRKSVPVCCSSRKYFPGPIPPSPFHPNFTIKWDFNTSAFLQRPDVKGQPPKLMTWMVKTRYMPPLPEPVRLRVCPEMPCRMTTNQEYRKQSAALLWAGQIMREPTPPVRSHPDQVRHTS